MICPNRNSQAWKDLVEKYGEAGALIHLNSPGKVTASSPNTELRDEIYNRVIGNESYYLTRYKSFLSPLIGDRKDATSITTAFFARLKDLNGKLVGDIIETAAGNYLLFPETKIEYKEAINVPTEMENLLEILRKRHNIPFRIIHETSEKWGGRYVNQGDAKIVVINTAYANANTPLHEYYHPFVRKVKMANPVLFNHILNQAQNAGDTRKDEEEVVTDYLANNSKKNTITSSLRMFWQYIANILGLRGKLTVNNATTLSDLLVLIKSDTDFSTENTLTSAFQKAEDIVNDVKNKISDRKSKSMVDYIEAIKKTATKFTTSDASNFYQDEAGKDIAKRLTAFIGDRELGEFSTTFKKYEYTYDEWATKQYFKKYGVNVDTKPVKDITETIEVAGKTMTFSEILATIEKQTGAQRVKGKMIHAFLQYMLEDNKALKEQAKQAALGYAKEYGVPFYKLETHPELHQIHSNFNSILETAGLYLDTEGIKGIPKDRQDKVVPEVTLKSNLLVDHDGNPIATTADGIIQHYNGEMSLIDWKTGWITKDMNTVALMKYGDKFDIPDSRLSRGYLELAFRAVILKEQFPDMVFRNIRIVKLNKDGSAVPMDLDLQPYLYTIGEYYKKNHPNIYSEMKDKGLLDATNYSGTDVDTVDVYAKIQHMELPDQVKYLKAKLASFHYKKTKEAIERDPEIGKLSAIYARILLEVEKLPGANLSAKTTDIPFTGALKGFSDMDNPKVQTLHKIFLEAKKRIQETIFFREKEHDRLIKEVLADSDRTSFKKKALDFASTAGVIVGVVSLNPVLFFGSILSHKVLSRNLTKTRDLFAFMWKEASDGKDPVNPEYYMNTEDTYTDREGNVRALTQAQRNYRDFVQSSMKEEYAKFASTVVGFRNGNDALPIRRHEALGMPAELWDNFMPRIPKEADEIREEETFTQGVFGLKTTLGTAVRNSMTSFLEDTYESEDPGIRLKYFMHAGSNVVSSANHSMNAEEAYKKFMASLVYKTEMDPIYDMWLGVTNALKEDLDENQKPRYDNVVKWMDDMFYPQVLRQSKSINITKDKWRTIPMGAFGEKVFGIPKDVPVVISQDRVLRMLKTSVTFSTMAFKIISPVRNAMMIAAINLTQSTRNIINTSLSKILGIPPETFEGISPKIATPLFKDYIRLKMLGQEDKSKLWNLAKRFDWLPDHQAYAVNNDRLLSKAIQMSTNSHAYMFYQLGENFGALWQLAGLLNGIEIENAEGKKSTLWDAYDDEGNWKLGTRGKVERGSGVLEDLNELDALEIKNLKRAYEKLNGSYRQEEKMAIETTVLGEFLTQFKRYFYQYMKVLFASPYKDITVGKYMLDPNAKRPDGMPVYQWHSDVMQGQLRVMAGAAMALMLPSRSIKKYLTDTDKYGANTLQGNKVRALGAAINTGVWLAMLTAVFAAYYDDDEKKSYTGRLLERTIQDTSRGLWPKDIFETIKTPIVASERISNIGIAFWDFLTDGAWGEASADGFKKGTKTLLRATPGFSNAIQMQEFFGREGAESDNHLFGILPR